jgi:hypothetical protein
VEIGSKRTRTVCFRVPEEIIKEIEKEAKMKLNSTNVLINQILHQYVSWGRYEHRMRMFPIPEDNLFHVFNSLNEMQAKEAIEKTFSSIRDWALITRKKFDIHSCLEVLEDYCRLVNISVEENNSAGYRSFVIRHNMGPKISSFIDELVTKIFWELTKIKVESQSTRTTVVVKLLSKFD